jgi:hypothetical protein
MPGACGPETAVQARVPSARGNGAANRVALAGGREAGVRTLARNANGRKMRATACGARRHCERVAAVGLLEASQRQGVSPDRAPRSRATRYLGSQIGGSAARSESVLLHRRARCDRRLDLQPEIGGRTVACETAAWTWGKSGMEASHPGMSFTVERTVSGSPAALWRHAR